MSSSRSQGWGDPSNTTILLYRVRPFSRVGFFLLKEGEGFASTCLTAEIPGASDCEARRLSSGFEPPPVPCFDDMQASILGLTYEV